MSIACLQDPLPEEELQASEAHCQRSDLVLALGTSLRIEPAGSLPMQARKFCIVNFQTTPKDTSAELIVRAPVDDVMAAIMRDAFGLRLQRGDGGACWVAAQPQHPQAP